MNSLMNNENLEFYENMVAVHPGYHIHAIADDLGMSQKELAARLGITEKSLSCLLHEKSRMTLDVAERLYAVFGISVQTWMNMQTSYELHKRQIAEAKALDEQVSVLCSIEYGYFAKLENMRKKQDSRERVVSLCNWLQIADLRMLHNPNAFANYRTATKSAMDGNKLSTCAWLCYAMAKARSITTAEFSLPGLKKIIPELKKLMTKPLKDAINEAKTHLANCGIAFLVLPYMKNTNVNGAVTWFTAKKAAIIINDWRKSADFFWFTFFHEIGHVLQQKHKLMLISCDLPDDEELEKDANDFANNLLMPDYDSFVSNSHTLGGIRRKACELGILPGMLAGRMARDGYIEHAMASRLCTKMTLQCS